MSRVRCLATALQWLRKAAEGKSESRQPAPESGWLNCYFAQVEECLRMVAQLLPHDPRVALARVCALHPHLWDEQTYCGPYRLLDLGWSLQDAAYRLLVIKGRENGEVAEAGENYVLHKLMSPDCDKAFGPAVLGILQPVDLEKLGRHSEMQAALLEPADAVEPRAATRPQRGEQAASDALPFDEQSILVALRKMHPAPLVVERIEAEIETMVRKAKEENSELQNVLVPISARTIGGKVRGLVRRGYVVRLNGAKGGCSITVKGLAAIEHVR